MGGEMIYLRLYLWNDNSQQPQSYLIEHWLRDTGDAWFVSGVLSSQSMWMARIRFVTPAGSSGTLCAIEDSNVVLICADISKWQRSLELINY